MPDIKIETITIPLEEYKKMVETHARVEVFKKYVEKEEYSIDREMCGTFFGFEVKNGES